MARVRDEISARMPTSPVPQPRWSRSMPQTAARSEAWHGRGSGSPPPVVQAWVAEVEGRVVGHVAVMRPRGEDAVALPRARSADDEHRTAVLARLYVVREARGRAAGGSLRRAAMEYARQHELRLVLDVMTKDTGAVRLCERLGRQPIEATATVRAAGPPPSATSRQPGSPLRHGRGRTRPTRNGDRPRAHSRTPSTRRGSPRGLPSRSSGGRRAAGVSW